MRTIVKSFLQGLLVFVPIGGTAYILYWVIVGLDGLIGVPLPGLGLAILLITITLLGALTSNVIGERAVKAVERAMKKLPVVSLLYASLKDLLGAFVGDRRSFDKPVMVDLLGSGEAGGEQAGEARVFGFVTCDRFDDPRLRGYVAVYLPQSYNFAGNLIIVKQERVQRVDADAAQFMAFIVSGGVAEMSAARTFFDGDSLDLREAIKKGKR